MAITQAVANSFKTEVLTGTHNFTATTGNSFKISLYTNSATLSKSTATGNTLTSVTPTLSSDTAVCDFADTSWTSATITARGALIYNDTQSDKAVVVLDFGGDKTSTAGTFTIQFPAADASNAILRLA
jgi:hypothetical protein